ncbi:hypothetical protein BDR04DRAFT_1082966 [Suillus decipiens]|nr:hypothetical protein BDR04DRAFT_1082966 [Suillus decipiens]
MIFKRIAVFAAGIATTLAQTIELGYPQSGDNSYSGQGLDAQVILPVSIEGCIQVGIALGIKSCVDGSCFDPADGSGSVLYAGPWTHDTNTPGIDSSYQNFTVTILSDLAQGLAIFTLTHLCLIGANEFPLLEYQYRNATVNIV